MKFAAKYQRRVSRFIAGFQVSQLAREVGQKGLTYLSSRKLLNLENCLARINSEGVLGDVLEFGVALGGSGILLAKQLGPDRRYFGFDVFGMIPPPNPEVDRRDSMARYRDIVSGNSKGIAGRTYYGYEKDLLSKVEREFATFGVSDPSKTLFVKGLFEDTWPTATREIDRVALVHIDCDWHDPIAFCLANTAEKLSVGGFIVVDDYNDYSGAKSAVDEFLRVETNFRVTKRSENLIIKRFS